MKKSYPFFVVLLSINYAAFAQSITLTPAGNSVHVGDRPEILLKAFNIPTLTGIRSISSNESPSALLNDYTMLRVNGRGFDGTSFSNDAARIRLATTENWNSTSHGSALMFETTPNGNTDLLERMRINQNGRIGIGITSPLFKLHLKDGNFAVENDLPYLYLKTTGVPGAGNAGIIFMNSLSQAQAVIRYDHGQEVLRVMNGSSAADGISVTKNASSSNMVGIGTLVPAGKLHITSNSSTSEPQLVIEESTSLDYGRINFNNTNSGATWALAGRTDDNVANMRFNIYNSVFGNVASFYGSGNAQLAGFTQLGSSAPKIKMVKLTGITDDVNYSEIPHGSSLGKILDVSVFVYVNDFYKVPPGNAASAGNFNSYDIEIFTSYIKLTSVPENLQGRPYEVLLTIEE